jgi:PAS domain S-box-containing protein
MSGPAPQSRNAPNVAVPLHALFEAISDGVLITDAHGRRTYVNPALRALLGDDPSGQGDGAPEWMPPAQRERFHDVVERTASASPGDEVLVLKWALIDGAGDEVPVIARLFPVRASNGGDYGAVLWLLQSAAETERRDEWHGALERIAGEVARLGFVSAAPSGTTQAREFPGAERLTKREREIVTCLLEGERVVSISHRLNVSPHTVRNHLKSIFRKLRVHSQAELVSHVRRSDAAR